MSPALAFDVQSVAKRYGSVTALVDLTLRIEEGERVALVGPSGAGKTTLLYLLAGLITPDAGLVRTFGRDFASLRNGRERSELVGVMHQQLDLVPNLAVIHNVLAGRLGQWGLLRSLTSLVAPRDTDLARAALRRVGLDDRRRERTSRLSGGQQQRVALARLLVQNPRAILADEPVSALDPARAENLIQLLVSIADEGDRTLVASLHTVPLALEFFDRIVALRDGRVHFDMPARSVRAADMDALYALADEAAMETSAPAMRRSPVAVGRDHPLPPPPEAR